MKILKLRNILGVAAVYGAARYAKNHGGYRQALGDLADKLRGPALPKPERVGEHEGREPAPMPAEANIYDGSG